MYLGGLGAYPPPPRFFLKFEPSESGSEAFRDIFEVLVAVIITDRFFAIETGASASMPTFHSI